MTEPATNIIQLLSHPQSLHNMSVKTSPSPSPGSGSVGPDRHNSQSTYFDPSKRHVINRACDICRRRKVRCDGAQAVDGRSCAYCIKHGIECTYNQMAPVRRGPSKAYVTHLEHKIDRLKEMLEQAIPGIDVNEELEADDSSKKMFKIDDTGVASTDAFPRRRSQFWTSSKWELAGAEYFDWKEILHLPPPDLFESLIELFFKHVSPQIPIIHEPTLRAQIRAGLHTRDHSFARLMLAICALAARWTDDPRVLHESERTATEAGDPNTSRLSAGVKYFNQIRLLRRSMPKPAVLFDIQTYVLSAILVQSSFEPHNAWIIIGLGLRSAQDVGMHRRRVPPPGEMLSVEDEMTKRSFWALLCLDRLAGLQMGRPSAIQDVDLDLDPVVDFPESSWPADSPANPAGLRSAAYMNCWIRTAQIAGFALQTIFALNKSKIRLGFGSPEWEAHLVMQIDSDLNAWLENIPPELRWNPLQPDHTLLSQSAMLYAGFYALQISVHRPFIISKTGPTSSLYQPSVAIVTSAARMISQITDVVRRRKVMPGQSLITAAFSAG
ncbi:hypothetical protein FRC12_013827 [Ceratobasidium sp. 428]|nr:hypothetical protein FRC12_013827 [Ceratobasidium sp. 428]